MNKFNDFLEKYEIKLSRKKNNSNYDMYYRMRKGLVNPSVPILNRFYYEYRDKIGPNKLELFECFNIPQVNYEMDKPKILYIANTMTKRRINYYITSELIKKLSSSKILVIDQPLYDDLFNTLEIDVESDISYLHVSENGVGSIVECVLSTKYSNVDYSVFYLEQNVNYDILHNYEVNDISEKIRNELYSLDKYDYILINYIVDYDNMTKLLSRASDSIFVVTHESSVDKYRHSLFTEIKLLNPNLEIYSLPQSLEYINLHVELQSVEFDNEISNTLNCILDNFIY
ncbi:MAG: hypothetical protein N4A40_03030 [Tissierellales bacterium]|jgi:hypothetical protein|nr:hypothetical protein [Tissierellales bacterium]